MSRFFMKSARSTQKKVVYPTLVLCVVPQSDGTSHIETRCVETELDKLNGLSFSDFSLSECIKNGVSYKSLQLSKDIRLGYDADIDAFNEHLESISSELFESQKS